MGYTINEIIKISREEASKNRNEELFYTMAAMCVDMTLQNASSAAGYDNIIKNHSEYPTLKDAAIHSMKNDGWVGYGLVEAMVE